MIDSPFVARLVPLSRSEIRRMRAILEAHRRRTFAQSLAYQLAFHAALARLAAADAGVPDLGAPDAAPGLVLNRCRRVD